MSKLVDELRATFTREMTGPERIADAWSKAETDEEREELRALAHEQSVRAGSQEEFDAYRNAAELHSYEEAEQQALAEDRNTPIQNPVADAPRTAELAWQLEQASQQFRAGQMTAEKFLATQRELTQQIEAEETAWRDRGRNTDGVPDDIRSDESYVAASVDNPAGFQVASERMFGHMVDIEGKPDPAYLTGLDSAQSPDEVLDVIRAHGASHGVMVDEN